MQSICETNILAGDRLDFELLQGLCAKPQLFARGKQPFWDDPHISAQMLRAHLDPGVEAASRSPLVIEETVRALVTRLDPGEGDRVLDLGCGPGLYANHLARLGLDVTGIDCSRSSIQYARERALADGLSIQYVCDDYLTADFGTGFAVVLLIYGDLCALTDCQRDLLLSKVRSALQPGGYFAFDVTTRYCGERIESPGSWCLVREGFWRPHPHMVLQSRYEYPEHDTSLEQYVVIDSTGETSVYRVWDHYYSPESITAVLRDQGLIVRDLWGDLTGHNYQPDSPWMGIIAVR